MSKQITREELAAATFSKTPPVIFEALDKKYFDHGHLPGARMMPPAEIDETVAAHVARKDQPIVLYCASETCMNSHQAADRLTELGYSDVAVYPGGKQDWSDAGLRLER